MGDRAELPRIGHWVGGKTWEGSSRRTASVTDPSTGSPVAEVLLASSADVGAAVSVAREAFVEWSGRSLAKRTQVLFAFRDLVEQSAGELARRISAEHGKVVADARGEVVRGLEVVELACGVPQLLKGGFSQDVSSDTDVWSIRQPLGVVAGITPFNFPAMVPMWMFPLALACGNAFVLKPSERDPSASLFLADLLAEAGLPDGVFTVLHGDREAVDALLDHPDVPAVSFVGSTPVALHVYERAAAAGKRVQALGGAKNHMVVLPDADLDLAADAAVSAGFGSSGERCMAISVVVAVGPVGDDLVARIVERSRELVLGRACDPGADLGPLITAEHRDRVRGYVEAGVSEGAQLVVDGREVDDPKLDPAGFWMGPTVFDHVDPRMRIYRDEIFGPVLCVVRVDSLDDALGLIARNPYGNGVALFTRDGAAARRFQVEAEAGMVGINVAIPVPVAFYPFGGWGSSLFGDTHVYGTDGVHFYTRSKVVTARWQDPAVRGPELGFPTAG